MSVEWKMSKYLELVDKYMKNGGKGTVLYVSKRARDYSSTGHVHGVFFNYVRSLKALRSVLSKYLPKKDVDDIMKALSVIKRVAGSYPFYISVHISNSGKLINLSVHVTAPSWSGVKAKELDRALKKSVDRFYVMDWDISRDGRWGTYIFLETRY